MLDKSQYPRFLLLANVLICVLLVISILFFVRDIFSFLHKDFPKEATTPTLNVVKQESVRSFHDYDVIMKNNPFGYAQSKLTLLSSSQERRTDRGDIKLVGTISGSNRYSFAIFADRDNRQETVRVGKKVFDYGILKEVEKNKAIIQTDSGIIEIPLQDILNIEEVTTTARGSAQSTDFIRGMSAGTFMVDKKMILHAIDNPNELMTDARLQPNIIDGKQEGFILREVKNNGLYQKLGLQNGDVLLRINDYNIVNPESALQAFYAMRGLDRIQLDIVRNGNRTTLTYLIK